MVGFFGQSCVSIEEEDPGFKGRDAQFLAHKREEVPHYQVHEINIIKH